MRLRYFAAVLLGAALGAPPLPAQSAAEQLQKGIYAQETAGDLDSAIRIYRQVIASNPAQRVFAAQAQMHLAQALLQKGDLAGAAQEFNTLAATYPEFHDLIADMAGRMQAPGRDRVFSLGTASLSQGDPDRYRHNRTGVELTAPAGWSLEGDNESSGGGEMVRFSSSNIQTDALAVWMKPANVPDADIPGMLRDGLARKAQDRTGFSDWKVRPESIQSRVVGGQQALGAIADYNETAVTARSLTLNGNTLTIMKDGSITSDKMVEYLILVRSPKTYVFFFGRAKVADLAALQSGLDELAASAVIP